MRHPRLVNLTAMLIFGSIGLVVRMIPLPSDQIALARGLVGCIVLMIFGLLVYRKMDWQAIRRNLKTLVLSGIGLGFNWVLLFEAYRYTSISVATICYYFAPVLVTLLSPLLIREKLSGLRLVCVLLAMLGLILVVSPGFAGAANLKGILYGLGAAAIYCSLIFLNKSLKEIGGIERTFVQLGVSAVAMTPHVFLKGRFEFSGFTPTSWVALAAICVIYTGLAYFLYFSSFGYLPSQTVALLSYSDPLTAILLSALLLRETLTPFQWLGGALVLGATLVGELWTARKNQT